MRLSGEFGDMEEVDHIEENDYSHLHFLRMKKIYSLDEVAAQPADHLDDLAKLPEVTKERLLTELYQRYSRDRIYTLMGDILIAMNPFKPLPIYGPTVSQQYQDESQQKSLAPHIYTIAEQSHRALLSQQISQCCVISGESGAGKTETCKMLVEHLNVIAHSLEANLSKKINQVNPLLEAFGNAQTVKNSNSSRFGKYLELVFSSSGEILGGKVNEYLLESSRIVFHGPQETSFHIFYLLYAGLNDEEKAQYYLTDIKDHRYLNTSRVPVNSSENQIKFIELRDCMQFVGFSKEDMVHLMKSLAAVLHIGDIEFVSVGNNEAAKVANVATVAKVADLLELSSDGLAAALEEDSHMARGEQIRKERSLTQASDARDALAKTLYRRLFSWIVNGINQLIQNVKMSSSHLCLGIFDIFGFENFDKNSFEQLCINLTNEQLQFYFNQHIFALEKKECEEEGLNVHNDLSYNNNETTLNLFLNSMGILAILDEESRFPKATDHTLATKLHNGPGRDHEMYIVPPDHGLSFGIRHYAGPVTYNLNGVLDKNRDTFPSSLVSIMKNSNSTLISDLFQGPIDRRGSIYPSQRQRTLRKHNGIPFDTYNRERRPSEMSDTESVRSMRGPTDRKDSTFSMSTITSATTRKGAASVAYHFKNSLTELIHKMKNSAPHFVRCIKPNSSSAPDYFNKEYITEQLAYSGILETIRIRKNGFPLRLTPEEFLERYELLSCCLIGSDNSAPAVAKCKDILSQCNVHNYKIGKTRIFLRVGDIENLELMSLHLMQQITVIQAGVRCLLAMNLLTRKMEEAQRQAEEREALEAFSFQDQPLYDTHLPEPSDTTSTISSMSSQSPFGSSDQPLYDTHLPSPFGQQSPSVMSSGSDQPLYDTHLPSPFEYSSGSQYSPRPDGLPPRGVNPVPLPPRHIAPVSKKDKRPPPSPPKSPVESMRSIGSYRPPLSHNGGDPEDFDDAVSVIDDSFNFLDDGSASGPIAPRAVANNRVSVDVTDSLQQLDKFLDEEYQTLRDIEITRSISSLDQVIQMYDYDTHIDLSGNNNLSPSAPPAPNGPPPAPPKMPNPKKTPPSSEYSPAQSRRDSDSSLLDDFLPRGMASPVHVNRKSRELSSQPDSLRSRRQQIVSPKNY